MAALDRLATGYGLCARRKAKHFGTEKHIATKWRRSGSRKMSPYKVMVDDNFRYGEEDERSEYGTF